MSKFRVKRSKLWKTFSRLASEIDGNDDFSRRAIRLSSSFTTDPYQVRAERVVLEV